MGVGSSPNRPSPAETSPMHSTRLLFAGAMALLLSTARPAGAQGVGSDDIGPHGCIQSGPEGPAATMLQPLPSWLTALQTRFGAITLRWTADMPWRARFVAQPALRRPLVALRRPKD